MATPLRALFGRGARRRRQEELLLALVSQLTLMTEEIRRSNLIQHHRLIAEQQGRAMDDPSLATAASSLTGVSEERRRQIMFVNRWYAATLLSYRIGSVDWDELLGNLRVLCRGGAFAEYWERTAEHRRLLPEDSFEARVGREVDTLLEERADDPDEWWVVSSPLM
ncbi:DUF6082 family protein [Streptomyces justiciae]|uniref:DUF6082 family protein n=1 Tax=Streptomyces justiciae TaxID=2780140 RepID=A0ABU3LWN6_9ACTN|nr:DUF6082 family protein [Streptomyces justiciae]MBE8477754.1 hypothetical protein [Streptomyces justiciae]MCW8379434.1 DUF6082 family protein [Streptomyces justiciae]MDT7843650.1 DUF6082 family protein [Streptomyces justiciae]